MAKIFGIYKNKYRLSFAMICSTRIALLVVGFMMCTGGLPGSLLHAEQHRATHLGNPATRFAPPLSAPEDLRSRFRDPRLRPDFAEVLRQWGWKGKLEDMFRAAESAPIQDITLPVGEVMPFMSSRENGKPICLRNVLWAGKQPAPAYAFYFTSDGVRYRCITPKACSNFFLEDHGPELVAGLIIECAAPPEALPERPLEACFTIRNPGTGALAGGTVHFAVPENMKLLSVTDGGAISAEQVTWAFTNLAPKAEKRMCARLSGSSPGVVTFNATASGTNVQTSQTSCATRIIGIPAILIDAIDLEDPVEVGHEVTYVVKVTNQGSSEATNVRLVFILPPNEQFVSGGGASPIHAESTITTEPVPVVPPKGAVVWEVVAKAMQAGDVRFQIKLTSDQFVIPIHEEESTLLY